MIQFIKNNNNPKNWQMGFQEVKLLHSKEDNHYRNYDCSPELILWYKRSVDRIKRLEIIIRMVNWLCKGVQCSEERRVFQSAFCYCNKHKSAYMEKRFVLALSFGDCRPWSAAAIALGLQKQIIHSLSMWQVRLWWSNGNGQRSNIPFKGMH